MWKDRKREGQREKRQLSQEGAKRMVASAWMRRSHQEPHQALKMYKANRTQGFFRRV